MPPRQKGESKTGLIVALVFFILTTIGLGIGTYTGYTADEGKDATIKKLNGEKKNLEADREWWKFQAMCYRAVLGHLPGGDVGDLGLKKEQFAQGALGTGQKDKEEVTLLITNILDKKANWNAAQKKYMGSYEGLLVDAQKRYDALEAQLKGVQAQLAAAEKRARDAEEAARTAKQEYDAALAAQAKKVDNDQNDNQTRVANLVKDVERLGKEKQDLMTEQAVTMKRLSDESRKKDEVIKQLKDLVAQRTDELTAMRQKTTTQMPKNWNTDWKIVTIAGTIPYINLGSADKVKPQLTFSIHGVGPDGKPLQEPKGTLEVVNVVDEHLSQARITNVKDPNRNPVLIGDVLFNPSWDPNLKKHVALTGIIDLTGDGRDSSIEFRRNLERQNVIVDAWLDPKDYSPQGKITVQTDYLILGDGVESLTNVRDREGFGKKLNESMIAMKKEAEKNGVQVVSLRKYLEMIGYPLPRPSGERPAYSPPVPPRP
jgi:hypothetical protein